MSPIVRARGWGYRHPGRSTWALRDLDLAIEPGERVLLAGPSGAGKSTLLWALAGLLDMEYARRTAPPSNPADTGRPGEYSGRSGTAEGELHAPERSRVGMVFQDPDAQLVMATAGDDVGFGLENHAVPTERIWPRVEQALERVGFGHPLERPIGQLSGGEKQRLVLAGVLVLGPDLILLDEPTANLDPAGAALVRRAVWDAAEETGATLVLVEHRVADWMPLIDRVVVLGFGGGVHADGPPSRVFGHLATQTSEDQTNEESPRGQDVDMALAEAGVWAPGFNPPVVPAGSPGETALLAERVSYTYPRATEPAVRAVSLRPRTGETLAITGENGSGKSTLALLLAGLLPPGEGEVQLADKREGDTADTRRERRRRQRLRGPLHRLRADELVRHVGTVFQDPEHQFLRSTVREELTLGPRLAGEPPTQVSERVDELLARLRLDHVATANPYTLSGGEQRRLSVATALASSPRVLVLDEPTFGQDPRTWVELVRLLAALRDDGHAIVCVSHDEDFVRTLADRRCTMAAGRASRPREAAR